MTVTSTAVHLDPDEVVGVNVMELTNGVYALRFATSYMPFATLFINKQQLADLCRDMEVIYMVDIQGASEQDVRM